MFSTKSSKKVLILALWLVLAGIAVIKPADASVKRTAPQREVLEAVISPYSPAEVIISTNRIRANLGLNKLEVDKKLSAAAQARADHMVQNNYFAHITPTGEVFTKFLQRSGYKYRQAGENIAMQQSTLTSLINSWQLSPGHNQNLVNSKYKDVGIGISYGKLNGREGWVVVQIFGSKL